MKRERYKAWAVEWRYPNDGKPYLAGRYWFGGPVPQEFEGHLIGAFKTRREAKEAIKGKVYGKGRVVRIEICVRRI